MLTANKPLTSTRIPTCGRVTEVSPNDSPMAATGRLRQIARCDAEQARRLGRQSLRTLRDCCNDKGRSYTFWGMIESGQTARLFYCYIEKCISRPDESGSARNRWPRPRLDPRNDLRARVSLGVERRSARRENGIVTHVHQGEAKGEGLK